MLQPSSPFTPAKRKINRRPGTSKAVVRPPQIRQAAASGAASEYDLPLIAQARGFWRRHPAKRKSVYSIAIRVPVAPFKRRFR
jgi:hypothetical protein